MVCVLELQICILSLIAFLFYKNTAAVLTVCSAVFNYCRQEQLCNLTVEAKLLWILMALYGESTLGRELEAAAF